MAKFVKELPSQKTKLPREDLRSDTAFSAEGSTALRCCVFTFGVIRFTEGLHAKTAAHSTHSGGTVV